MSSEFGPVRMKPLSSVLEGRDPGEYLFDLLSGSSNPRLYVRVPAGFRCEFNEAKLLKAHLLEPADFSLNNPHPTYLQLDEMQVQELLEKSTVSLGLFSKGAMFLRRSKEGKPSLDYDYRRIRQGRLMPPHLLLASFDALFVEAAVPVVGPDDPYGLKNSSPLVFTILEKAFENRGKKRSEIVPDELKAYFRRINDSFAPAIKNPFKDERQRHAANLANPTYGYDGSVGYKLDLDKSVEHKDFFRQDFINSKLSRVLYAACCWSGKIKSSLDGSAESLSELLIDLKFSDYDATSEMVAYIFFITGKRYKRSLREGFKHENLE